MAAEQVYTGLRNVISVLADMLKDKDARFMHLAAHGLYNWMSDERYIRKLWKIKMGTLLDLDHPKTFNEKLQWMKLHDRNPLYTTLVDKYNVKKYVAAKIGREHVVPVYGVWNRFEDIDFSKLPKAFVLKCTHDSGGLVIVPDKSKFDIRAARKKLNSCLKRNFYYVGREWAYKNVRPGIMAEKYIRSGSREGLTDYKVMCFHGKARCSFTCTSRYSAEGGVKVTFFDLDWNVMPFERHYSKSDVPVEKPAEYDRMIQLAEELSKGLVFARIDFYIVNGRIYFGEYTLYPGCGMEEFHPYEWDYRLGSWIQLPV